MIYFVVTSVFLAVAALALFIYFLMAFRRFQEQKWAKRHQYFIPTVAALALFGLVAFGLAPRTFDSIDMVRGNYMVVTVELEELRFPQTVVTADGSVYQYSRVEESLQVAKTYLIHIAPRTQFAVQFDLIER